MRFRGSRPLDSATFWPSGTCSGVPPTADLCLAAPGACMRPVSVAFPCMAATDRLCASAARSSGIKSGAFPARQRRSAPSSVRAWLRRCKFWSDGAVRVNKKLDGPNMGRPGRERRKLQLEQWQLWLAIWGALTGTVAVGWQIWSNVSERPLLQVAALPPNAMMRHELRLTKPDSARFTIVYPLAVSNGGYRPISVLSAQLALTLKTENSGMAFEGAERETFPPKAFPLILNAGEARELLLPLLFEAHPGSELRGDTDGYIRGDLVIRFQTTIGEIKRTAEFRVSTYQLNTVRYVPE